MRTVLQTICSAQTTLPPYPRNIAMEETQIVHKSPFSIFRVVPEVQLTSEECDSLAFLHRHGRPAHIEDVQQELALFRADGEIHHIARAQALLAHLTDLEFLHLEGNITFDKTVTAGGTTGAQTINKNSGQVNFAAGASTLVVTNSLVTTSSIVIVQVLGTDATALTARVTKASGSFTITLNAAATAETAVSFLITN